MKAVIQRVKEASVSVDGEVAGSVGVGFLILLGAKTGDTEEDVRILAKKVAGLRIFSDDTGKMNRSVLDIGGGILVVSQFTLCADLKKGNRPSFMEAMEPAAAQRYYELFCKELENAGVEPIEKGVFGADMQVSLINDGPVTITMDTEIWRKNGN